MKRLLALFLALMALSGCSARPVAVKPARALAIALSHPEVAAWHKAHSAPLVLEGMSPVAVRGLERYKPVAMVDLVREGLLVRFESALGPRPRRIEVIVNKENGEVLAVKRR
ncbi:MAG: hypothetical protein ACOY94_27540 [Bacillota bacterium]